LSSQNVLEERVWNVVFDEQADLAYLFMAKFENLPCGKSKFPQTPNVKKEEPL